MYHIIIQNHTSYLSIKLSSLKYANHQKHTKLKFKNYTKQRKNRTSQKPKHNIDKKTYKHAQEIAFIVFFL